MSSHSASLLCCWSSSPGDGWGTSRSGTRTFLKYRDRQRRRRQLKVSSLTVCKRKSLLVSLTRKETPHVYHYHDVATCDVITAQASYHRASLARLLCYPLCRGMDCHAAPGAGPERPGPPALHDPTSRALSGVLLLFGTGCDGRADPGRLCGDCHHRWENRGAAVTAALCALASRGSLVP